MHQNLSKEIVSFFQFYKDNGLIVGDSIVHSKCLYNKIDSYEILSQEAREKIVELFVQNKLNSFLANKDIKLNFLTRPTSRLIYHLLINTRFEDKEDLKNFKLDSLIINLLSNYYRNYTKVVKYEDKLVREKIDKVLNIYQLNHTLEQTEQLLSSLVAHTRADFSSHSSKGMRSKEFYDYIEYLSPNFLQTHADIFLPKKAYTLSAKNVELLMNTKFSQNKKCVYLLLNNHLSGAVQQSKTAYLLIDALKNDPEFLNTFLKNSQLVGRLNPKTLAYMEKQGLDGLLNRNNNKNIVNKL